MHMLSSKAGEHPLGSLPWMHYINLPMAEYDDLSLPDRLFMKGYPFSRYRLDPVPGAPLSKPLAEARVALVTTAGLHTAEQRAFDHSIKMGDTSFREIPNTVETQSLEIG